MIRVSFHRLMLSVLLAVALLAAQGRGSCAMSAFADHHDAVSAMPAGHAGHDHAKPGAGTGHATKFGRDCGACAMACCAAVLPVSIGPGAVREAAVIRYAARPEAGQGVGSALDPEPPRPA